MYYVYDLPSHISPGILITVIVKFIVPTSAQKVQSTEFKQEVFI